MNAGWRNIILTALLLVGASSLAASDDGWPRDIALEDGGTVTVYEPQVDSLDEQSVSFRAALAYREKPGATPIFGAGWFESDVQVNRFSRTAHPIALRVTQTRFPVEEDVQPRRSHPPAQEQGEPDRDDRGADEPEEHVRRSGGARSRDSR